MYICVKFIILQRPTPTKSNQVQVRPIPGIGIGWTWNWCIPTRYGSHAWTLFSMSIFHIPSKSSHHGYHIFIEIWPKNKKKIKTSIAWAIIAVKFVATLTAFSIQISDRFFWSIHAMPKVSLLFIMSGSYILFFPPRNMTFLKVLWSFSSHRFCF